MDTRKIEALVEEDGILLLAYGGNLTQSLIVGMTEALEKENEESDMSKRVYYNIFAIFIELSQNMMNYSKKALEGANAFDSKGMIIIGKNPQEQYYIISQNIVNEDDKKKIETKLEEIKSCSQEEIRRLYRETRRKSKDPDSKGGGIGFYEIAKRATGIEYEFAPIDGSNGKYYFKLKVTV